MEDNIYLKLARARVALQKLNLTKSGKNAYAGFNYFELKDFLSQATEVLLKEGLVAVFNIEAGHVTYYAEDRQERGSDEARLTITDGIERIVFRSPVAEATVKGASPIQNLGSMHTYLKRYLYLNALELSENDTVDATIGKKEEITHLTPKQAEVIQQLYTSQELQQILRSLNLKELKDLSLQQAIGIIKKGTERKNGAGQGRTEQPHHQ